MIIWKNANLKNVNLEKCKLRKIYIGKNIDWQKRILEKWDNRKCDIPEKENKENWKLGKRK